MRNEPMNIRSFTGGKWFVDEGDYSRTKDPSEIFIRTEHELEQFDICSFACDETLDAKGNAALIASAPDMHRILSELVRRVVMMDGENGNGIYSDIVDEAKAILNNL